MQVSFSLGEGGEYVLDVDSFRPPTPPTREDPGEDAEISFLGIVQYRGGHGTVDIPFGDFLSLFSDHTGLAPEDAADELHRRAITDVLWQLDESDVDERDL